MEGILAIVMIFSIPIVAIVSGFFIQKEKIKGKRIKDEIELERLKHENYLLETEKLRMELEKMVLKDDRPSISLEEPKEKNLLNLNEIDVRSK